MLYACTYLTYPVLRTVFVDTSLAYTIQHADRRAILWCYVVSPAVLSVVHSCMLATQSRPFLQSLHAYLCLCCTHFRANPLHGSPRRGKVFWPSIIFSLLVTTGVAITTYVSYNKTQEFVPQGLVCSISVAGIFFYVYQLSYVPEPKRKL